MPLRHIECSPLERTLERVRDSSAEASIVNELHAPDLQANRSGISLRHSGNPLQYWYTLAFPGAAVFLFVLSWNLVGDALRDVLDPRHSH